jgi:glucokinase
VNADKRVSDMRVGLDIGATKVLGAVVDADGAVVAQSRQDTRPGADGVLASATAVLDSLALRLDGALPSHIGIGVCGIVDRARGAVSHAVNLGIGGDWFPLAERLAGRTGATVLIDNDVNAATWGAHVVSGADDMAYLSVGTGLAAGFVLSGSLRRGAHGAAAEIGHLPGDPDGPRCSCGQRGCLELSASGSTLAAAWPGDGQGGRAGQEGRAGQGGRAGQVPPAAALFAAAAAGNAEAVAIRDRFAASLAAAIRITGLTVGPAAIIIGGGVASVGEPLREAVTAALRAQADGSPFLTALDLAGRVSLLPGHAPVGAIGAALIGNA